jgi:hypothetical protein
MDPNFQPLRSIGLMAMIRPKSPNSNIGMMMVGIERASIRNFALNQAQLHKNFSYSSADQQPKIVLPTSVGSRNFLFITYFECVANILLT